SGGRAVILTGVGVHGIAIVALLVAVDDAVTAEGAAGGPAGARPARAVGRGGVGRESDAIALLAVLVDVPIAARRQCAVIVAAIRVDVVAVVTLLAVVDDAVTAVGALVRRPAVPTRVRVSSRCRRNGPGRVAGLTRCVAHDAVAADRGGAVVVTGVGVHGIAVVAQLAVVDDAIAAEGAGGRAPAGAGAARAVAGGSTGREGVGVAGLPAPRVVDGAVSASPDDDGQSSVDVRAVEI